MSLLFKIYRLVLSPAFEVLFNTKCRYEESCSRYSERVLKEKGLLRGSLESMKRILSCSMWSTPQQSPKNSQE